MEQGRASPVLLHQSYVDRDGFLAVQNGTTPARIVRFSLDLQKQEVLEANTPGLGEPTHGTLVGGPSARAFYFIANSGWDEYDQHGVRKSGGTPVESSVWKLSLSNIIGDEGERQP